jgi:hypothetical protein
MSENHSDQKKQYFLISKEDTDKYFEDKSLPIPLPDNTSETEAKKIHDEIKRSYRPSSFIKSFELGNRIFVVDHGKNSKY